MEDNLKLNEISGWVDLLQANPPARGAVDLHIIPLRGLEGYVSAWCTTMAMTTMEDRPAFSEVCVIAPVPSQEEGLRLQDALYRSLDELAARYAPAGKAEALIATLRRRVRYVSVLSHEAMSIASELKALPEMACALVLHCERLRSPSTSAPTPLRTTQIFDDEILKLVLDEDSWVPRMIATYEHLRSAAQDNNAFVIAQVDRDPPEDQAHVERLRSIDGAVVYGKRLNAPPSSAAIKRWLEMATSGRERDAFAEIDTSDASAINRALLKAQISLARDRGPLAYGYIEPFLPELICDGDARIAALAARIARHAGRRDDATALLRRALDAEDCDYETLVNVRQLSRLMSEQGLVDDAGRRLVERYPHSDEALKIKFGSLVGAGGYAEAQQWLSTVLSTGAGSRVGEYLLSLASAFGVAEPDFAGFIRKEIHCGGIERGALAALDAMREMRRRQQWDNVGAVIVTHSWPPAFEEDAAEFGLEALERLLLASEVEHGHAQVEALVRWLVRFVATHPARSECRLELTRLLSPSLAGTWGIAKLLEMALAERTYSGAPATPADPSYSLEEEAAGLEALPLLFERLRAQQRVLLLGATSLDLDGLPASPRGLLAATEALISRAVDDARSDGSAALIHMLMAIGVGLARKLADRQAEQRVISSAVVALGLGGEHQAARDVAEHLLKQLDRDSTRAELRGGWYVFADVYLRAHNLHESALALACAAELADSAGTSDQAFRELYLTARLARSASLDGLARSALDRATKLIDPTQLDGMTGLELGALGASIDLGKLLRTDRVAEAEQIQSIEGLSQQLVQLSERATALRAPLFPLVLQLAQLQAFAESVGVRLSDDSMRLLDQSLEGLSSADRQRVNALSHGGDPAAVLAFHASAIDSCRFSEDLATDVTEARVIAQRIISQEPLPEAQQVAFALDWMGDHGIPLPASVSAPAVAELAEGGVELLSWAARQEQLPHPAALSELLSRFSDVGAMGVPPQKASVRSPPPTSAETFDRLEFLVGRGLKVHLMGLSGKGRLVHAALTGPQVHTVVEPPAVFNAEAYGRWQKKKFPYAFGEIDTTDAFGFNSIERIMDGLGMSLGEETATQLVLVPEPRLQMLPANLLKTPDGLLGSLCPVTVTPSLGWLRAAVATPRERTYRRVAWISRSLPEDALGGAPLDQLREFTSESLAEHGFASSGHELPPRDLAGADVAFIGAHGGIGTGQRFFRVVADEHRTRLSARELANRCADCGVVVLAVCSAGRADLDPFSTTTHGLARLLLQRGCRAVVAPPWPMEVKVMRNWLPEFLEQLDRGLPVGAAVFSANIAVSEWLSKHPMLSLAMHAYGDPLLCIPKPPPGEDVVGRIASGGSHS